jgi:hypothetical protein
MADDFNVGHEWPPSINHRHTDFQYASWTHANRDFVDRHHDWQQPGGEHQRKRSFFFAFAAAREKA